MRQLPIRIRPGLTALALACCLTLAASAPARAGQPRSVQTEAEWVAFDAGAKTITAKVKKPGRGKDAKRLKQNREATWAVTPEGSVLTRTTVAINGVKAELADISTGRTVNIYWRPDEQDPTVLRARKVDVILSDAELDAKYGVE
jgi:hypothetical protein